MNEPAVEKSTLPSGSILSVLGPGILYAAAAVGVSHLIQATRAGADYGLGLTLIIVFACIIKYPSLRFGSDYAAATGKSLITSYRAEGWWAFSIYALAELFSMGFIVAAISLFTLGLFQAALGFEVNAILGVSVLLTIVVLVLFSDNYHLLEKITKYVVAMFTVLIIAAVALVVGKIEWSLSAFAIPSIDAEIILYLVAIIGFMPTPSDGSVLQSLWTCARAEDTGHLPTPKEAQLDFNVGYITSVALGLCFLILGAGVMNSAGVEIATSNTGFSRQLMELFTETIGSWSFPLIAIAAIFVMLSTLFTVVDGMTRIVVGIAEAGFSKPEAPVNKAKLYNKVIVSLCVIAVLILATMMKSFATFIDITSVIVFVISPILAYLNHRAMWSDRVPVELQPSPIMKAWSLGAAGLLMLLTLVYFYFRLFS
jgi:Mn2+/Fe2+ NRAMP family transporter